MDEYGDSGLKLPGGSSRWLIITASLFGSRKVADECGMQLTRLHEKLGGREFHFTNDRQRRREEVFGLIAGFPFTYHFIACDKERLILRDWKPNDLYEEVAGQLIDALKPGLENCTVWFDTLGGKKSDREHGQRLVRRAGHTPNGPRVKHVKRMDSAKQPLGQLADYVCGAVSRSIRAEADNADEFRKLIKSHEGQATIWPLSHPENATG
jgi:hypothetical protein